jgi:RNA polymerase sigma-70 factor, ECF subfamily
MIKALSIQELYNPTAQVMHNVNRHSDAEMLQEWALLQKCTAQPALFRSIYDKYYEQVFRFIQRRTNDMELSADICAQVFLKAMQSLPKYKFQNVPYSSFLYRVAANEVVAHFRLVQRHRTVSIDDSGLRDIASEFDDSDADDHKPMLMKALTTLKEDEMQLIELRFFEKKSFKEVADIMDMTENNAKVKSYRIIDKLKTYFKNA